MLFVPHLYLHGRVAGLFVLALLVLAVRGRLPLGTLMRAW